jgi:AraC family chitin signaling transcriptional activator
MLLFINRLFALVFLYMVCFIHGNEIKPLVKNFTKQQYAGDNQIWNITQADDGSLYFANHQFLLRYNGVTWEKYTMPNQAIIRSVFAHEDKIYVGGYNEFGYWQRLAGKIKYHSLSAQTNFFSTMKVSEEIWKIYIFQGDVYFQSFSNFYCYSKKILKKIKLPTQISYAFNVDNQLYIATINEGIMRFDKGKFSIIEAYNLLKGKIIHGIEKVDDKLYFFTQKNGVFIFENNELKAWQSSFNQILINYGINVVKKQNSKSILIGTALNGLYVYDIKTDKHINFNKFNSLANNTILSILTDKDQDIWLGLDNGVSQIEQNEDYKIFYDQTGQLGSVYDIKPYKNGFLLGSNHGLFVYDNNQLKFVEHSQGHVWNIYTTDNETYIIGHNDGTFSFKDNIFTKINNITGGWKVKKNLFDNTLIQANYTGLAFYDPLNQLTLLKQIFNNYRPIKNFVQVASNEFLLIDNHRGLFYINSNLKKTVIKDITALNNIKNDYQIKHLNFRTLNLFYIDKKWFTFDILSLKLIPNELFNQHFKGITDAFFITDDSFSIIKNDILYYIYEKNQKFYWHLIPKKYYNGKIINGYTSITVIDNYFYINLDDGFFKFKLSQPKNIKPKVMIEAFSEDIMLIEHEAIPFNSAIKFHIIDEYLGSKQTALFYQINNGSILPLEQKLIEISNSDIKSNSIKIFVFNGANYQLCSSFSWKVSNPWYFSWYMICFYIILSAFFLWLYYQWNKRKYEQEILLKEEEMNHQNELIKIKLESENQLNIQEFEKKLLENQVDIKANELAGKSLSIAKQTELIDQIQIILNEEISTKSIKQKIYQAIKVNKINKNEWKSFETNLLKSNESFVQKISHKYPNLTPKDIKLCIYLKMNLSSKEIAPLMNISFRGVELHRYRLRKKLDISNEINICNFMNNLN